MCKTSFVHNRHISVHIVQSSTKNKQTLHIKAGYWNILCQVDRDVLRCVQKLLAGQLAHLALKTQKYSFSVRYFFDFS